MPNYHIIVSRPIPLLHEGMSISDRTRPRHPVLELAKELDAIVHEPDASETNASDGLRSVIAPSASLWSLARRVRTVASPNDVIFCWGEAGGIHLAAQYGANDARPRIVFFAHNVDRPRARLALNWWNIAQKVDLFLACSQTQADFLRGYLHLPDDRVRHIWDHTDTQFFSPGASSEDKKRPLIVSVGLEQRDYKTLAEATRNLDVDVKISGYSLDAKSVGRAFPKTLPENMTRRFYEWSELLQLYRDADVVVVSCFENNYAAGVQVLLEAMACKRPVIATKTSGLKGYLDDSIMVVAPQNVQAMQDAIMSVLKEPLEANFRADKAHSRAVQRHDTGHYVKELAGILRALS